MLVGIVISQRPVVCAAAANAGMFEVGMTALRTSSPAEWACWCTPAGLIGGAVICCFNQTSLSQPPGVDLIKLFVDSGAASAIVSTLQAFELRGASKVGQANIFGLANSCFALWSFDLTAKETEPIVALIREIPSTLRFVLDHDLNHVKAGGQTTATACAMVTAVIFGKEEDGGFSFTQEMIRDTVCLMQDCLTGNIASFLPVLPSQFLKPVVHLCISDTNKALLVQSAELLPSLLLDAMFLRDDHVRKDADVSEKAPVQTDAADACLQLALSPSGRELLSSDPALMDALRSLADKAYTEEAKLAAQNALVAIEGVMREPEPEMEGADESDKHIFVSYQWNVQATIERVVRSLQARGFIVWYDLDCMKGSTVDVSTPRQACNGSNVSDGLLVAIRRR